MAVCCSAARNVFVLVSWPHWSAWHGRKESTLVLFAELEGRQRGPSGSGDHRKMRVSAPEQRELRSLLQRDGVAGIFGRGWGRDCGLSQGGAPAVQPPTPFISSLYPAVIHQHYPLLTPTCATASLPGVTGYQLLPKMTRFVTRKCLYDMFFFHIYIFVWFFCVFFFFYSCTYDISKGFTALQHFIWESSHPTCFYF